MIEEQSIPSQLMSELDEHVNIRQRLASHFAYFNEDDEKWHTITNIKDPDCQSATILVHARWSKKLAKQTVSLPYPFALPKGLLYLWGLIAGSTCQERNLGICIDANQEHTVYSLAKKLGFGIKVAPIKRSRRRYGAGRTPSYYRKVRVTFPATFLKLVARLGLRNIRWLSLEQRQAWLEGYLNSGKLQCQIQHQGWVAPKLTLAAPKALLPEIQDLLDHLGIYYLLYQTRTRSQIVIQRRASLQALTRTFRIRRPKVDALLALLRTFEEDAAVRLSLNKLNLTEFQFTLYGVVVGASSHPDMEVEYTAIESVFARSSNEIRQNLYLFDRWGLISYYERENSKEYFMLSAKHLTQLEESMRKEVEELKAQLKYTEANALSFHCPKCDKVIGYAEAIGDRTFECPDCHTTDLQPIELSRYFYYGRLGILAYQQKMIEGALA